MLNGKFEKGKIVHFHIYGDRGKLGDESFIASLLKEIVRAIDMTPHGDVEFHRYPTPQLGFTATACVAVQHLHESYVVYDNWVEYDPAYANIVINSCRSFDHGRARAVIEEMIEPKALRVSGIDYYQPELVEEK